MTLSDAHRRQVTAALLIGTFLASLEVSVVGAAMPTILEDLRGVGHYGWPFTAYLLAQTVTMPLYGAWADRRGRREAYLVGVSLFLVGCLLCATAPDMTTLIVGRAVQGVGAGAILPLTMTIFGDIWPLRERTRMQGWFSLVWGVSSVVGPLVGGAVTEAVGWPGIFWLNLPPGLFAFGVVALRVPASLGRGAAHARPSAWSLLREPTQQAVAGAGLLLGGALMGFIAYLPVHVQGVGGGSALDAGLALLPLSIAWTAASNVAGRVVMRVGFRALVVGGTLLVAAGSAWAAFSPAAFGPLVLFGAGMGFTIATFTVSVQEAAPPALRGTATSWSLFARSIGGAAAAQLFGGLAGFRAGAASLADVPDLAGGLHRVFVAVAVMAALGAGVVMVRFPRGAS